MPDEASSLAFLQTVSGRGVMDACAASEVSTRKGVETRPTAAGWVQSTARRVGGRPACVGHRSRSWCEAEAAGYSVAAYPSHSLQAAATAYAAAVAVSTHRHCVCVLNRPSTVTRTATLTRSRSRTARKPMMRMPRRFMASSSGTLAASAALTLRSASLPPDWVTRRMVALFPRATSVPS